MSEPRILLLLRRLRASPDGQLADEVLGPCERAALAAAVTLADDLDAHLTALAVGRASRENRVLAMALRAGCHKAARIEDGACGPLDYLGVAKLLAAYARRAGFDLILCGARSQDEQQGAVGAAVAEELSVPHASGAVDLRVDRGAHNSHRSPEPSLGVAITTPVPGSGRAEQRVPLPGLITVARFERTPVVPDDDAESRLDRVSQPFSTLEELSPEDLGIDPRELRHRGECLGTARPSRATRQPVVVSSAKELVGRLRADHLIRP